MRPRREQACEACRARKARCEPSKSEGLCSRCEGLGVVCVPHEAFQRRKPQRRDQPKGKQYRFIGQDKVRWKNSPWQAKQYQSVENGTREGQTTPQPATGDPASAPDGLLLDLESPSNGGILNAGVQEPFGRQLLRALKVEIFHQEDLEDLANLTPKACTQLVSHYQDMSKASPFALQLRTTDIYELLSHSPLLLLSIILTASSSDTNLQQQADRACLQLFAERVIVQGQKAMEIFQSLLTYLNWYHLRFDPRKQQFYQFVQLSNGMASDLFLPRIFSKPSEEPILTDQLIDQARAFLQCYYLNVACALGFDRCETMQCHSNLETAAKVLRRARERPLDQDAPAILGLMKIACCHQKDMKEPKDDKQCIQRLDSLQKTLHEWTTSHVSVPLKSMVAPTYHFVMAYTFLKSKSLRQPGSPALRRGLETCQAVLFHILEKGPCHLVKLSIVEWAHLITVLFIFPWLEVSAIVDLASASTPLTLYCISAVRSQLADLKLRSGNEPMLKAETLFGWLEAILTAVETRASTLSDRFRSRSNEEETAFELVNSFLNKDAGGLPDSLHASHGAEQPRSKEDAWLEFMSDWLDW